MLCICMYTLYYYNDPECLRYMYWGFTWSKGRRMQHRLMPSYPTVRVRGPKAITLRTNPCMAWPKYILYKYMGPEG